MLRSYGMSTNLIANFIHLPISQLQDAIGAFEQYKSKQEESGGKLENPIGALRTAIEKNWKPNVSKADKENLREQDLMKKDDIIKSNKQFAINLYHDNMELFKDNFNFKVSDNIVTCKNGFGYHPLSLLDENFRGILSNYVKNQGFR